MTDSPDGGPLSVPASNSPEAHQVTQPPLRDLTADVPRTLSAYGEGHPLPPMETQADRDAFEADQRRGWLER